MKHRVSSCPFCIYRERTLSFNSYPEFCPRCGNFMHHNEFYDKREATKLVRTRYVHEI